MVQSLQLRPPPQPIAEVSVAGPDTAAAQEGPYFETAIAEAPSRGPMVQGFPVTVLPGKPLAISLIFRDEFGCPVSGLEEGAVATSGGKARNDPGCCPLPNDHVGVVTWKPATSGIYTVHLSISGEGWGYQFEWTGAVATVIAQ